MSKHDFAGIDVGATELVVRVKRRGEVGPCKTFANKAAAIRKLCQSLRRRKRPIRVCLEATGIYSLDIALALHEADGVEVMVVNPRAARSFADALMTRAKTDPVDAGVLLEFAERMPFGPWQPPSRALLQLRQISRRIATLRKSIVQEKNRLHCATSTESLGGFIQNDIEVNIRHLERRVRGLQDEAIKLVKNDTQLQRRFEQLLTIKGVAEVSAIQILPELAVLPADMTARQWTAHAGLDPRHHTSGSSIEKKTRISKAGNKNLRAALYMPALVATTFQPEVRAFYLHLIGNGKSRMQALIAVMRKLLHAIHGMFRSDSAFDGTKFFRNAA